MAWGGRRPGAGRKPNPNKPRQVAEPKLKPVKTLVTVPAEPKIETGPAIDPRVWVQMLPEIEEISKRYAINKPRTPQSNPFRLPDFPKAAIPSDPELTMAMDSALTSTLSANAEGWLSEAVLGGVSGEGLLFLGYTYLAELAQRPEYRVMSETIADDMTRKWIDFDVVGDADQQRREREKDPAGYDERMADPDERQKRLKSANKLDRVKELKDDQLRLGVKARFYEQARNDGFFGRSHLYCDIWTSGQEPTAEELATAIGDGRGELSKSKVPKGSFKRLQTVEPVWTYPLMYNAINPLKADWYNPQVWYVMGRQIHGSRIKTFIGHPVPDMLKPAYAFGGLSLSQMAKPYVDIWLQTRQSIADLIHSFSVMVLMTDLSTLLSPNAAGPLLARIAMFNMLRDNQGTFVVNKNTEDFKNVSASLSGLHELQSQSQEHMACLVAGTLVETDRGQVPIEEVTLADRVLTRVGFLNISWVGVTGHADTFIEIEAAGSIIRATEEHPIWCESSQEFVDARNVSRSQRLLKSTSAENTGYQLSGVVAGGGARKRAITEIKKQAACFIASCGKRIAALSRTVTNFITAMKTAPTTIGTISSCSPAWNTSGGTLEFTRASSDETVRPAETHSPARSSEHDSVPLHAKRSHAENGTDGNRQHIGQIASSVELRSPLEGQTPGFVPGLACSVPVSRVVEIRLPLQPVYNIEVDGLPEFFANGLLVHNSVHRIPLVKFTGIQPAGLNASSEGEIEVYDDTIMAYQSRFADPNLREVINYEMLSLWGEVDPEITHRWEPLRVMTQKEKGEKEKNDADRNQKYVDMGAISPGEVRKIIIEDPELPFTGLDPDDVPEPPAEAGLLGPGAGGAAKVEAEAALGRESDHEIDPADL